MQQLFLSIISVGITSMTNFGEDKIPVGNDGEFSFLDFLFYKIIYTLMIFLQW